MWPWYGYASSPHALYTHSVYIVQCVFFNFRPPIVLFFALHHGICCCCCVYVLFICWWVLFLLLLQHSFALLCFASPFLHSTHIHSRTFTRPLAHSLAGSVSLLILHFILHGSLSPGVCVRSRTRAFMSVHSLSRWLTDWLAVCVCMCVYVLYIACGSPWTPNNRFVYVLIALDVEWNQHIAFSLNWAVKQGTLRFFFCVARFLGLRSQDRSRPLCVHSEFYREF